MSQDQGVFFDEKELAEIIAGLHEASHTVEYSHKTQQDWIDFRNSIEKYLRKLKEFAKRNKATQFNIEASVSLPPRVNVGLTFTLE